MTNKSPYDEYRQNDRSLKKWTMRSFVLLSLFAVTVLTTVNCGRGVTRSSKLPLDDHRARYLLFPGNAETKLHRAVIVNGAELSASKEITYYDGTVEKHIAWDKLSLFPPALPETLAKEITALNLEIERWGKETDIRRIDFSIDGNRAKLTMYLKSGKIDHCTYEIRGVHTPASVTLECGL